MIKNKQYRINKSEIEITPNTSLIDVIKKVVGKDAIRWYISQITSDEMIIQATLYSKQFAEIDESVEGQYYPGKTVVVNIIPTGIGCSIGGYAGDATPTANLLASTVDYLITNPNTVNASNFINLKIMLSMQKGILLTYFVGVISIFIFRMLIPSD